jgi:hypothetical protein
MVLAHDLADDPGAFARGTAGPETHLLHGVENAAMDRLKPIANIRQRAADDDRERVVKIRPLHLLFNIDRLNIESAGTAVARRRSQGEFGILGIVRQM